MTTSITSLPIGASHVTDRTGRGRLTRFGAWILQALEASGQARARRHLLDFAEQCESTQPELAKELRAASRMTH